MTVAAKIQGLWDPGHKNVRTPGSVTLPESCIQDRVTGALSPHCVDFSVAAHTAVHVYVIEITLQPNFKLAGNLKVTFAGRLMSFSQQN